jgi:phage tail protein X
MDYNLHTTIQGDRWDLIAWDHYGDPFAFEEIIRANPAVPPVPVLAGGIVLQIPIMTVVTEFPDFTPWQT